MTQANESTQIVQAKLVRATLEWREASITSDELAGELADATFGQAGDKQEIESLELAVLDAADEIRELLIQANHSAAGVADLTHQFEEAQQEAAASHAESNGLAQQLQEMVARLEVSQENLCVEITAGSRAEEALTAAESKLATAETGLQQLKLQLAQSSAETLSLSEQLNGAAVTAAHLQGELQQIGLELERVKLDLNQLQPELTVTKDNLQKLEQGIIHISAELALSEEMVVQHEEINTVLRVDLAQEREIVAQMKALNESLASELERSESTIQVRIAIIVPCCLYLSECDISIAVCASKCSAIRA